MVAGAHVWTPPEGTVAAPPILGASADHAIDAPPSVGFDAMVEGLEGAHAIFLVMSASAADSIVGEIAASAITGYSSAIPSVIWSSLALPVGVFALVCFPFPFALAAATAPDKRSSAARSAFRARSRASTSSRTAFGQR